MPTRGSRDALPRVVEPRRRCWTVTWVGRRELQDKALITLGNFLGPFWPDLLRGAHPRENVLLRDCKNRFRFAKVNND